MIRIFTYSYRRLNHVCALVNALKSQTRGDFVHHLHLLGYSKEQAEFVGRVVDGDGRFVVSELENLDQRGNLLRILAETPSGAECYLKMDDDDVYLPTYLEEISKAALAGGHDLTAFTTLLRHNQRTGESHLVAESGIYGMTMCLSRRAVEYLLTKPDWDHRGFEDSWLDKSLELAGFKRHITRTARPQVLYVQHATNISCADREAAEPVKVPEEAKMPAQAAVLPTLPRGIPEGPPDGIIAVRDEGVDGSIGLYETGVFVRTDTGEAGNWDVADDGNLILDYWGSGRKVRFLHSEEEQREIAHSEPSRGRVAGRGAIPRIIHQTWKAREIGPPFREEWCAIWRDKNPGWDYRLWTDEDLEEFVQVEYPWFLKTFLCYDAHIKRVDAARYLILNRLGGVYADMDFICLKPLAPLLDGRSLVFASQYENVTAHRGDWVCNAWMASAPGHPFWKGIEENLESVKAIGVLDATGPFMLSKRVLACRDTLAVDDQPVILPSARIHPVEWHEAGKVRRLRTLTPEEIGVEYPDAYALTVWTGSWR